MRTASLAILAVLAASALPAPVSSAARPGFRTVELPVPATVPSDRFGGLRFYFANQPAPSAGQPLGVVKTGEVTPSNAAKDTIFVNDDCAYLFNAALANLAAQAKRLHADAVVNVRSPDSASPYPRYVCMAPTGGQTEISVSLSGTAVRLN